MGGTVGCAHVGVARLVLHPRRPGHELLAPQRWPQLWFSPLSVSLSSRSQSACRQAGRQLRELPYLATRHRQASAERRPLAALGSPPKWSDIC